MLTAEGHAGFSLFELMVVLVIIAILAFTVVGSVSSADAEVRSQAFLIMTDFNLARTEAIKRGRGVLVELVVAGETDDDGLVSGADGYRICLDLDDDGNCDSADRMIKENILSDPVTFYNGNVPAPTGPNRTVDGDPWPIGQDGISFTGNRFVMHPNGSGNKAGAVYLFVPGGRQGISGGPLAVVLNRIGRIRVTRWHQDALVWRR